MEKVNLEKFREKFEIFIVDEVYSDFVANILFSMIQKNTIIIKSLSKSLGIAGLELILLRLRN